MLLPCSLYSASLSLPQLPPQHTVTAGPQEQRVQRSSSLSVGRRNAWDEGSDWLKMAMTHSGALPVS